MQADHTSSVHQYSFGDTLSEQEAQLRTNPLLQRFRAARQARVGGASLVDGDRVIVHYYGHQIGNVSAVSRDPLLLNWQKVPGGIPEPAPVFSGCLEMKSI